MKGCERSHSVSRCSLSVATSTTWPHWPHGSSAGHSFQKCLSEARPAHVGSRPSPAWEPASSSGVLPGALPGVLPGALPGALTAGVGLCLGLCLGLCQRFCLGACLLVRGSAWEPVSARLGFLPGIPSAGLGFEASVACGAWDEIGVEDGNVLGSDLSKARLKRVTSYSLKQTRV